MHLKLISQFGLHALSTQSKLNPMEICFLLPANHLGGGSIIIFEHARRLKQRGHSVSIIFQNRTAPKEIDTYPHMEGIPTEYLDEISADHQFDFAIATWWETVYVLDRIQAKHYGYFIQGFEMDFYSAPIRTFSAFVEKTYLENLALFTISRSLQRFLKDQYGREAILVPNSINFDWFRSQSPIVSRGSGKIRILIEGSSSVDYKRIPLAFQVVSRFPEIEVFYVSPEEESDIRKKPHWKIDRLFSKVPYWGMPKIFASCDVLIKLSRVESFALPVLEMFATGGTAIVSSFPGHDEYIENGFNALVVPIDDEVAAFLALDRLLKDSSLLARLKQGAIKTCERFNSEASTAVFEKGLKENLTPESPQENFRIIEKFRPGYLDLVELIRHSQELSKTLQDIYHGPSWRLGRACTAPGRLAKRLIEELKN